MKINKKDILVERIRGHGPGGQNVNKVNSCVRITYLPTGLQVIINGRDQHKNYKKALKTLEERLDKIEQDKKAATKKAIRDEKIKVNKYIRTYDWKRQEVRDHRTGKIAPLKKILEEGMFDLLHPDIGENT